MCGISGILSYNQEKISEDNLLMMNRAIEHRGPDDNGIWISQEKTFGFSHNRLSILDLSSAGHQPMEDKNFDNIISHNGEIFNYLDINRREFLDETFSSDTDTETVLKLYKKYELGMLNMLMECLHWLFGMAKS